MASCQSARASLSCDRERPSLEDGLTQVEGPVLRAGRSGHNSRFGLGEGQQFGCAARIAAGFNRGGIDAVLLNAFSERSIGSVHQLPSLNALLPCPVFHAHGLSDQRNHAVQFLLAKSVSAAS